MNQESTLLEFWDVVEECLVRFHSRSYEEAHQLALELRANLNKIPEHVREDAKTLIYHEQPFYVACNLARRELDLAEHRAKYNTILERHGW